jgi:hypothetical protein
VKRSWLIQRLNEPMPTGRMSTLAETFSFGGGLRNGGLSGNAMELLRGIFAFDYMGAAEFEFGAVPEALSAMARSDELAAWSFDIDLSTVPAGDWRERESKGSGTAVLYAVAPITWCDDVEARVRLWAAKPYTQMQEITLLNQALRPPADPERASWLRTRGWLELDNGFAFFVDREMWEKFATLFAATRIEADQ